MLCRNEQKASPRNMKPSASIPPAWTCNYSDVPNSLGSCTCTEKVCAPCAAPLPPKGWAGKQEEKDTTMMYLNNSPLDIQQKAYLADRLNKASHKKEDDLCHAFNLVDDDAPESIAELVDRITKGRFVADDETLKRKVYHGELLHSMTWRDPAAKRDQDGYDAAYKAMQAAKTAATDAIMVKDADAGLAAVTDFASKTFH